MSQVPVCSFIKPLARESVASWNIILDLLSAPFPPRIARLLRCKIIIGLLRYTDRCYIAAHCFANGIHPQLIIDSLWLNPNCSLIDVRKIYDLYKYWTGDTDEIRGRRSRYYAYNLAVGRICDLNGEVCSRERNIREGERQRPRGRNNNQEDSCQRPGWRL